MQPGSARSTSHETNANDRLHERDRPATDHLSLVPTQATDVGAADQSPSAWDHARGQVLGDHARSGRLRLGQRIELFLQACDAVARAHEDGIHHGCLDPDSLIVVETEDEVRVQVVGLDLADVRETAGHGCRIEGGLEFRSPEQVIADSFAATASGDVYSLGVILYLLLADCLPHDAATLRQAREMGMLPWTYDEGPLSLVARVSLLGSRAKEIAHERRLDPSGLLSAVAGRLNDVVGKALNPDPSARYTDAGELARALRR